METSNVKISRLKEMIKVDTESCDSIFTLKKSNDFEVVLKKLFPNVFKKCRVKEISGSLVIEWPGRRSSAPILMMSHLDTSLCGGKWKSNPLACDVIDEKVYGKGVIDAKGNLYCMFEACELLIKENFVPNQDIFFVVICDKKSEDKSINEIYSYFRSLGTYFSYILDEGGACLVSPFNAEYKDCFIGVGEKESALIKIKAYNSGEKNEESVLSRLSAFIYEFEYDDAFKKSIHPSLYPIIDTFVDETSGFTRLAFSHPKLFSGYVKKTLLRKFPFAASLIRSSLSFTMINGSSCMTSVPNEAYVIGDLRISLNDSLDKCLKRINKIAKYYNLDVEVLSNISPTRVASVKSFQFMEIEEVINEVFPDTPVIPYISYNISDCRLLDRICSNCFRFVPFSLTCSQVSSINGIDENIDLDSLESAITFYKKLLQK